MLLTVDSHVTLALCKSFTYLLYAAVTEAYNDRPNIVDLLYLDRHTNTYGCRQRDIERLSDEISAA